jgi:DNA-directed RNA polymerase beta' subunit
MNNSNPYDKSIEMDISYPNSDIYDFETTLEILDLDTECEKDIISGSGFLISAPKKTNKKDFKNENGIYSTKFGQKLGDMNPFADRYMCECGETRGRVNRGMLCPKCGKLVKFVDDNYDMFGWITIDNRYHVLHPKFYDSLNYIFGNSKYNEERKKIKGTRLNNILNYSPEVDENGFCRPCEFKPDNEPFYGLGMIDFYERFDEILDYYIKKYPKKMPFYEEIDRHRYYCDCRYLFKGKRYEFLAIDPYTGEEYLENDIADEGTICPICGSRVHWVDKEVIFTHSIPVYTTLLRPTDIRDEYMYFEPTNGIYNMINKHASGINRVKRKFDLNVKQKNAQLFKLQVKWEELNNEIIDILRGKRGQLRELMKGRYNFSSREVIRQDPSLRVDQVKLPYVELVITLQQRIENVLMRTYNITPNEAYEIWRRAISNKDPRVCEILDSFIAATDEGIPVIMNRNPTLAYGSILQMFCVGYDDTLTLSIPLQVLKPLAADFDGDSLNIFHIINDAFFQRAYIVFNPRNAMYISRIDGKLNPELLIQRDTLINANTFIYLGRDNYSKNDMDKINKIKQMQKQMFNI